MHQLSSILKPAGYCSACSNKLDFYRTWTSHIHTKHLSAKNAEIEKGPENQVLLFVARPGFEPRQTVPKTVVLPLYYQAIRLTECKNKG